MPRKTKKEKRARHREFVKEYLANGNRQDKAYMKAFKVEDPIYASKAAYKLMRVPYIQELMTKHRAQLDEQYEINRGIIIKDLMELIEQCKDDADRQHLLKSLDMLNKMAGNYTEKKEVNVTGNGITFNFIKPEEEPIVDLPNPPEEPEEEDPTDRHNLPEEELD